MFLDSLIRSLGDKVNNIISFGHTNKPKKYGEINEILSWLEARQWKILETEWRPLMIDPLSGKGFKIADAIIEQIKREVAQ